MRILFCIRNDYLTNFAGDSEQLLRTVDYIRSKGISTEINNGNILDYKEYDIIHLFNLTRISEVYQYFKIAQSQKKMIVLTPIYWNLEKYYHFTNDISNMRQWEYYRQFRQEILSGCEMVFPASKLELESLMDECQDLFPYRIVYNGISPHTVGNENDICDELNTLKPYILCAARICPRKNQLALCQASNKIGIPVVLAGNSNSKSYLAQCLSYTNVHFYGFFKAGQLQNLYKNAILHVLCSFVETPGLTSLDAGYSGTDIVSTCEGSAAEYFQDFAFYCNPYDNNDIESAILSALSQTKQPGLKQHIHNNFIWEDCLNELYQGYRYLCPDKL